MRVLPAGAGWCARGAFTTCFVDALKAAVLALGSLVLVPAALIAAERASAGDPAVALLDRIDVEASPYVAPRDLDSRFTTAIYVNVDTRGRWKQRMWVLNRDAMGGPWRLGLWDTSHWKRKNRKAGREGGKPLYSWPVSSGRKYPGDRRSGPTPPGVYGLDERRWRYGWGWLQPGMRHVMHIDYHYRSGRPSGVAFHGTNGHLYRRLGRADSHGCIRMRQNLALELMNRITGRDGVLSEELRWGEVPRFWQSEQGKTRVGYRRDGGYHFEAVPPPLPEFKEARASQAPVITDAAEYEPAQAVKPKVLTKQGFRAVVVFFKYAGDGDEPPR